jgi:hypothetical protein
MNQPNCTKCVIESDGVTSKGLYYQIVKGLIIATDESKQNSGFKSQNETINWIHKYIIYIHKGDSYTKKMDFYSHNNRFWTLLNLNIYNNDGTITNVDITSGNCISTFTKCLRDDFIIQNEIKNLNMSDHKLWDYIMSFIPRLVYLFNVITNKHEGKSLENGDIPFNLDVKNMYDTESNYSILFSLTTDPSCKFVTGRFIKRIIGKDNSYYEYQSAHDDPTMFKLSVLNHLWNDPKIGHHVSFYMKEYSIDDLFDFCIMAPIRLANDSSLPIVLIDQETL